MNKEGNYRLSHNQNSIGVNENMDGILSCDCRNKIVYLVIVVNAGKLSIEPKLLLKVRIPFIYVLLLIILRKLFRIIIINLGIEIGFYSTRHSNFIRYQKE